MNRTVSPPARHQSKLMENNMDSVTRQKKNRSSATRLRSAVLAMSLAGMLTVPVQAYTLPVVEIGMNLFNGTMTEVNTLATQAEALYEYGEQAYRFGETMSNWAQKLAKFQQILASPIMPTGVALKTVPVDFNVAERCGTGSILSVSGLMGALNLSPGGDIAAQQRNICAAIQMLENRKYNETVEVVQKTIPDMRKTLDKIKQIRMLFSTEGSMSETMANIAVSDAYMTRDFTAWEMQVEMYDKQIRALTSQQQTLTRMTLKGAPSPLGTVVKTATLKAALSL